MKVIFTRCVAGPLGAFQAGDEADLPDAFADQLIKARAARVLSPDSYDEQTEVLQDPEPVETTAAEPVREVAAQTTGKRQRSWAKAPASAEASSEGQS